MLEEAKFFTQEFNGTLVSDFWSANHFSITIRRSASWRAGWSFVMTFAAGTERQDGLRDLEYVEKYKSPGSGWPEFAKLLRRLLGDAIRLWRRQDELPPEMFSSRRRRLDERLTILMEMDRENSQSRRLVKRLIRHQTDLFTFLDQPGVPFENNLAERAIRPAVIIHKNSYGNRSQQGADTQAILMSLFSTLKKGATTR